MFLFLGGKLLRNISRVALPYINDFLKLRIIFQSGCTILLPLAMDENSGCFASLLTFVFLVFMILAILMYLILILVSSVFPNGELFMCSLAIHRSSFEKCVQISCPF